MTPKEQTAKDLLAIDPLQMAEDITGKSYKGDEDTSKLALFLHFSKAVRLNEALKTTNDTTFSNTLADYQTVIAELGFELALELPFTGPGSQGESERREKLFIYVQRKNGIFLVFDTFCSDRVDGDKFYYCWVPNDRKNTAGATSSGCYESVSNPDWRKAYHSEDKTPDDLYWFGDHDCREAVRFHIGQLEAHGTFMPVWPENSRRRLYVTHHQDWKQPEYEQAYPLSRAWLDKRISERLTALPDWAKQIISYKE